MPELKDEEYRQMSNKTFARLPVEVASRYGCEEKPGDRLQERLDKARSEGDWKTVRSWQLQLRD